MASRWGDKRDLSGRFNIADWRAQRMDKRREWFENIFPDSRLGIPRRMRQAEKGQALMRKASDWEDNRSYRPTKSEKVAEMTEGMERKTTGPVLSEGTRELVGTRVASRKKRQRALTTGGRRTYR